MSEASFGTELSDKISGFAKRSAEQSGRGVANIEDQIRAAISLANGLDVLEDPRSSTCWDAINEVMRSLMQGVLVTEAGLREKIQSGTEEGTHVNNLLCSFLLSFASRAPTRDRLHVFTTNYDRLAEYGCDWVGVRIIDRFVGTLSPIFRASRIGVDIHYNPPGIRGEPRYLEGVIKLTKLHGSLDWRYEERILRRVSVPFGAPHDHPDIPASPADSVVIYPNPAKDVETGEYPYAELFRDFSAALCRPNSALVTYGYGFGDDHINRVIEDMLTLPSTHLVIISFDGASGRIPAFCQRVGHGSQMSLLIGDHFGDIQTLVEKYLPKPAIDRVSIRKSKLLANRGDPPKAASNAGDKPDGEDM